MALITSWIQRVVKKDNTWNVWFYRKIPIAPRYWWQCNLEERDVKGIIAVIPNILIRQIITFWFNYSFYSPTSVSEMRNQIIWFNSHIRVNDNIIFNEVLYAHNILYVHQFFDDLGNIFKVNDFQTKYNITINYLTYYSITAAIPRVWKKEIKIQHMVTTTNIIHGPLLTMSKPNHVCKSVYADLIEHHYGDFIATGYTKWDDYFSDGLSKEDWIEGFSTLYSAMKSTQTMIVQFKLLHFILVTKDRLFEYVRG